MSNDATYAAGLLNRALDVATQPPETRGFLKAEIELLHDVVADGMRVIDIGCGTGRHLAMQQRGARRRLASSTVPDNQPPWKHGLPGSSRTHRCIVAAPLP
jgi:hypothetical protein